jgi:uncharacterized protein (TIGR03086 family)
MADTMGDYRRALAGFDAIMRRVPPDRWLSQSPCAEWKAIDVAGHVIGGQHMVRAWATGAPQPAERPSLRQLAGDDPVAAWTSAREASLAALTPEALDRVVQTQNFGQIRLESFNETFILDVLVHTWDLAQASGQPVALPPDLVHGCFEWAKQREDHLRSSGLIGPEQPAPAGAHEQTRLMAFLGRNVGS